MTSFAQQHPVESSQHGFTVHPQEPTIGAEILNIDLTQPLSVEGVAEIRRLLLKHKVLFFRDQEITTEQQVAFAQQFGALYVHPTSTANYTQPTAHAISAEEAKNYTKVTHGQWHTDTSWQLTPSLGAVLRAVDLPEHGGDTLWADSGAIYRGLPPALKEKIDTLYLVHDFQKALQKADYRYPLVSHPIVRTHPETGEDGLFINFSLNPSVVGWSKADSDALLRELHDEISRPEYHVRFKWRPNSIAFWDNRATLHYPVRNYGDYPRVLERVLIAYDDIPYRVRPQPAEQQQPQLVAGE
jgi:taurine dioxygenase